MRLIDADVLLQDIEESANFIKVQIHSGKCNEDAAEGMLSGLELVRGNILRKPTAYNVDAVVEEIEEQKYKKPWDSDDIVINGHLDRAINAVRKGGV